MKIFNWVHRRFHHKDGFDRNVKKDEFVTNDADTQVLLEQIGLVDKLGGWRDGILTIGTLGFDPYLKDFDPKTECPTWEFKEEEEEEEFDDDDDEQEFIDDQEEEFDDEDDDDDTENDEINPLVHHPTTIRHGFDDDDDDDHVVVSKAHHHDLIMTIDGISLSPNTQNEEVDFDNSTNLKYEKMEKRGERITLADLFSADSDVNYKKQLPNDHHAADHHHTKLHPNSFKKSNIHIHTKNGISFAKKLLPRSAEDSRPIQKMQRLVTKMLKRKIHPDLEGKIPKKDTTVGLRTNKCGAINESISLLQTQEIVV